MAAFTRQQLDWRACDADFVGARLWAQASEDFAALGERAQCALMRAPLDYAQPGLGELHVALSRVVAQQPAQRLGAIVFNPGGPGGDGLGYGAIYARQWRDADPDGAAGGLLRQMSERYDLIGFSPRGTGASTPLDCGVSIVPSLESYAFQDRSLQNLRDLQDAARLQAQACIDNPLSRHIHTDATARDMDLMRELLAEEKLNYIGYSYGTWLGAWYAGLFPERVGRMLLDSSTSLLESFDGISLLQEMGQRLLDEVFLPYAIRHPQRFHLGDSVAELRDALLALPPRLKNLLFSAEDEDGDVEAIEWTQPESIDSNLLYINAALGLQSLLAQQPAAGEEQILAAIAAHSFAPDAAVNAYAAGRARRLAARLFEDAARPAKPLLLEDAVNMAVRCNDTGTTGDAQHWVDVGNEYAARYPLTGGATTANLCLHWPKPRTKPPTLAMVAKAGPLLMLQSRYDPLTPIEGAQAMLAGLPDASMIVVENDATHGIFPYGTDCVDGQVARYFLHGSLPRRLGSCAGLPLNADAGGHDGLED